MKKLKVGKNDIHRIGHTTGENEDGYLCILCNGETADLEALFLRDILRDINETYEIVEENVVVCENCGHVDIEIVTNMLWKDYEKI